MKILFLTKELPYPINNGHRMRSYHYIKGLIHSNTVTLLSYYDNSYDNSAAVQHYNELNCNLVFVNDSQTSSQSKKFLTLFFSLFSSLPFAIKLRISKKMQNKLSETFNKNPFDLIICDGIHQSLNIPANINCYKILDEHNVESTIIKRFLKTEKNIFKKAYAFLEWKKFVSFENKQWKLFDEIHVCSDVDKKQMAERMHLDNIQVVPNGVDIDKFKPQDIKINPNRIIYTGLIGWKPNEDAVLYFTKKIYPIIKQNKPDVEFFIVGKNPSNEIKNLSQSDKSITVTGFVDDVIPYICESAVYVVPLRIGSGTRLKILEAMGMGKAIISTSIGCEGIDVTSEDNIIIEDDPVKFANQVLALLNDPEKNKVLGTNAVKFVSSKYDWNIIMNHLNQLIQQVKL